MAFETLSALAFDALYMLDAAPFAKGKEDVCVFYATRRADGERVAVKVFPLPPLDEVEAREAIVKEFGVRLMLKQRAAPLADHPHLVPSLGLHYVDPVGPRVDGEPPVRAMLVMGLARGKSAEYRLRGGTYGVGGGGGGDGVPPVARLFSPAETTSVAYCLASALAHLHAHGVLHRDVKPANTLFFDGDTVPPSARSARLADFGESRIMRDGTSRGGKRGTDAFMAPEVSLSAPQPAHALDSAPNSPTFPLSFLQVLFNRRALQRRCREGADIWSLGATLFALLTKRELGKNEDWLDQLEANVNMLDQPTPQLLDWDREAFFAVDSPSLTAAERAVWAAAPPPLRELIVSCFALAPEKRPTAQLLLEHHLLLAERAEIERERGRRAVEEAEAENRALLARIAKLERAGVERQEENCALKEKLAQLEASSSPPALLHATLSSLFVARNEAEKAWLVAGLGEDAFSRREDVMAAERQLETARGEVLAQRAAFKERYTSQKSKDADLLAFDIAAAESGEVAVGADLFVIEYAAAFKAQTATIAAREEALATTQARALQQRGEAVARLMGGGGGGVGGGGGGGGVELSYEPVGVEALRKGESLAAALERHGEALAALTGKLCDVVKVAEKRGFDAVPTRPGEEFCQRCGGSGSYAAPSTSGGVCFPRCSCNGLRHPPQTFHSVRIWTFSGALPVAGQIYYTTRSPYRLL